MSTCFFIGHSDAPQSIKPALRKQIEECILLDHADTFYVGDYGAFDRMGQCQLQLMKTMYPELSLWLVTPYLPTQRTIMKPDGFDGIYYPEGQETIPHRAAIPRMNRMMVKKADHLIACVRHISSGSYQVLQFAKSQERRGRIRIHMI